MATKRKGKQGSTPEIAENPSAGRHSDQPPGRAAETGGAHQPDALESDAYRAERDRARNEGRMQGTKAHDMGHYKAAAEESQDRETGYPPGFNWGPRSGYAEEQVSGAPYNLSHDGDSFVQWRERRLQELDRTYYRWRSELAQQLDENYKRWVDTQQQAFTDDFSRWQDAERRGASQRAKRASRKGG